MNLDEFWVALASHCTKETWHQENIKYNDKLVLSIIRSDGYECPLSDLASKMFPDENYFNSGDFESAGLALGIEHKIIGQIANAADGRGFYNKDIRDKLIEILRPESIVE